MYSRLMKRSLLVVLMLSVSIWAQTAEPFHRSAVSLPLSNGATTATFDIQQDAIVGFTNHAYKKYDAHSVSADLCDVARLQSVPDIKTSSLEYINGTGVLHAIGKDEQVSLHRFFFAPMVGWNGESVPQRCMIMLTEVSNLSDRPLEVGEIVASLDFHLGEGGEPDADDRGDDVEHQWTGTGHEQLEILDNQTVVEWSPGGPHLLVYRALGDGGRFVLHQEEGKEATVSLHWNLSGLPSGQSRWIGVVVMHEEADHFPSSQPWRSVAQEKIIRQLGTSDEQPASLLKRDLDFWNEFHALEPNLDHLPKPQQEVYRQSTAFLKMGQVQEAEHPESAGQILASLKDKWARCWVRDASYAIVALVRSNHLEEAEAAVDFLARTRKEADRDYLAMINESLEPGQRLNDYLVSVCRYWGSGEEESDWNDHGPNIEYDNFGLFLWAYCEVAQALPPKERERFLVRHQSDVGSKVAEALLALQEKSGLLAPDSSIWEHHWNLPLGYDGRRHYSYSNITAWRGLTSLCELVDSIGKEDSERYRVAAQKIKNAMQSSLIDSDGALVSSLEDLSTAPDRARDAAVVEAVAWGMLDDPQPTMDALVRELTSRTPGSPGFFRNDDGNWYDQQEWLLLDLRAASAWQQLGKPEKSQALIQWVTSLAQANFNALGELLDGDGNFQGPFPMAGFGPGAYILAVTPRE